jgi:hypothetical protein
MRRLGVLCAVAWALVPSGAGATLDGGGFVNSPPVRAPADRAGDRVETTLRELTDARGLALLVEDDTAAAHLSRLLATWEARYRKLLESDPELARIDQRTARLFADNLAGQSVPASQLPDLVASIPKARMTRTLRMWLQNLLHRQGLYFRDDLDSLPRQRLAEVCTQARALDSRVGLPAWRYRVLMWRWRDSEVKRLFLQRDERVAFLTPVRISTRELAPAAHRALERYLNMLRNLRVEVERVRERPYERHRTLDGLLRGLRYMDTIREAARLTGLDHRMMTGLFIQESEFIHHRVSVAGAFSVAQFLNIAIKDVWLFRSKIPGSQVLLKGIGSWEQLRQEMIRDPRMAIRAACLYFRRVRDGIVYYQGGSGSNASMVDLLSLEMFTMQTSLMERSAFDTEGRLERLMPVRAALPLPVIPIGGVVLPDPGALLGQWADRVVVEMVESRLAEQVFARRLERLHSALGLASYNAGTGNLMKTAKRKHPYQALSFPLQIDETRSYVDSILDAWQILAQVDRIGSDIERMGYDDLMRLAERACRKAGLAKPAPSPASPSPAGKPGQHP